MKNPILPPPLFQLDRSPAGARPSTGGVLCLQLGANVPPLTQLHTRPPTAEAAEAAVVAAAAAEEKSAGKPSLMAITPDSRIPALVPEGGVGGTPPPTKGKTKFLRNGTSLSFWIVHLFLILQLFAPNKNQKNFYFLSRSKICAPLFSPPLYRSMFMIPPPHPQAR